MMAARFLPVAAVEDPAFAELAESGVRSLDTLIRSVTRDVSAGTAEVLRSAAQLRDRMTPVELRTAVMHPLYRHWRAELPALGRQQRGQAWLCHLPRLLLPFAAHAADSLPPLTAPLLRSGHLQLPGLPWHAELGPGTDHVVLRRSGPDLVVEHDGARHIWAMDGSSASPRIIRHHQLTEIGAELNAVDPWIRDRLELANAGTDSPTHAPRDLAPAPSGARHVFTAAAALIARAWSQCAAEMRDHVRIVVPFSSNLMAGWTSVSTLGAVYVRAAPEGAHALRYTAERLVHEAAHTRLCVASFRRPLFRDGGHRDPMPSPLRRDTRPAIGVYHAVFVLARVAGFMRRAARVAEDPAGYPERAQQCAADFERGASALRAARLTDFGAALLDDAWRWTCGAATESISNGVS